MTIIKPIVSIILLIPYVSTLGTLTFKVKFPDGTEVCYDGWLF